MNILNRVKVILPLIRITHQLFTLISSIHHNYQLLLTELQVGNVSWNSLLCLSLPHSILCFTDQLPRILLYLSMTVSITWASPSRSLSFHFSWTIICFLQVTSLSAYYVNKEFENLLVVYGK